MKRMTTKTEKRRRILRGLAAVLYIGAGSLHFAMTKTFTKIVPPYIPEPELAVYLSGLAEIAGGVGLLIPPVRRAAGWGLAALMVAVLPANVYMATDNIQVTGKPFPQWMLWARLPGQALLIWWVLYCRKTPRSDDQTRRTNG